MESSVLKAELTVQLIVKISPSISQQEGPPVIILTALANPAPPDLTTPPRLGVSLAHIPISKDLFPSALWIFPAPFMLN